MTVRQKPVGEQVVVITGASSGIGLATARLFAARGVKGLVLVARNEDALRKIAEELEEQGVHAVPVAADASKREELEAVSRKAIETFGGYDTWVNDAAVALYGTLDEIPIPDQRQLFEVNYWGVVYGSLIAARHLRARGGTIVNVGSVLSERAILLQTQYSAAKHAVKGFTDGLRMELEQEGAPIWVTLIKPSSIDTPYVEHARNYLGDNAKVPPPAYDPDLVAKAIVFASENRRRELTIGFGGWVIGAMGKVAPRLTDKTMEMMGYGAQTTRQPERAGMRDNLYQPREDGDTHSSLDTMTRKTSVLLAAQIHPLATAAILAGVGAAVAALLLPIGASSAPRRRQPLRRFQPVVRKNGNGHDKRSYGPGHLAGRDASVRPPQVRH
ncbi:SDR family oxidoreductase [Microvirga pudoricolor]|uniref:SDR family oxidoreductase n=1 Tax=Microvirga pudoricolor TaxID=2778729 RepID=UPI0019519E3F|nr:SDR family oxidoreductase [Microvirga pudoricolor]MBM6593081.1 SDR family oxidoreductase [Microvirga pudoricolor]